MPFIFLKPPAYQMSHVEEHVIQNKKMRHRITKFPKGLHFSVVLIL